MGMGMGRIAASDKQSEMAQYNPYGILPHTRRAMSLLDVHRV